MKALRTRPVAAGVALALSLTLAGCGQAHPDAAAVVGDRVVSESDVATASRELAGLQLPQPTDPTTVTQMLVLAPLLTDNLRKAGVSIGPDQARSVLPDPKVHLSDASVQALETVAAISVLQQAAQAAQQPGGAAPAAAARVVAAADETTKQLNQGIADRSIVVNPKYAHEPANWVQQSLDQQARQQPPQH